MTFECLNLGVCKNLEEATMFEVVFEANSFHFNKSYRNILHSIYFLQLGMCTLQKASPYPPFFLVTFHVLMAKTWCHSGQIKPKSFLVFCFTHISFHFNWMLGGALIAIF
jgi:hypothetical protein